MRAGFRSVLETGLQEHAETLVVDGTVLLLRFAGSEFADAALPALAPVVGARQPAEFTVELWDSESAGIAPPPPPWEGGAAGPLGAVKGYNDESLRTVVDPASKTITICDLEARRAVVWANSAAALSGWWRAMPLRVVLGWLLSRSGRHVVHAGAVGVDDHGLLFAGAGGAGKSTLAVMCLEAGMDYLGDDYVLLTCGTSTRAHALYGTAKLDEGSLTSVKALADQAKRSSSTMVDDDKLVLNLSALRPSRLASSTKVEAIIVPHVDRSASSTIIPLAKSAALRALAPSTIFQAPDGGASAFQLVSAVTRRLPCYELRLGQNTDAAPALLRSVSAGEI